MSTTVTYKGSTLTTVNNQTRKLLTSGKYLEDDITLVDATAGGTSKNIQVIQGTTRTTKSAMTAIGSELTVSKTGTYDVYWVGVRSTTSGSYTYATQLYIDGVAYGSENSAWSNNIQNNHLSGISLTANQKLRVYGRNSRNSSYYIYAPMLIIVEA